MKITVKKLKEIINEVVKASSIDEDPIRIGYLSAHIPGDHRYTDVLNVTYDTNDDTITVTVTDTSAAGGMDSYEGAGAPNVSCRFVTKPGAKPSEAMQLIKQCIQNSSYLFAKYGKPTKNFNWPGVGRGLSLAMCAKAIESAKHGYEG